MILYSKFGDRDNTTEQRKRDRRQRATYHSDYKVDQSSPGVVFVSSGGLVTWSSKSSGCLCALSLAPVRKGHGWHNSFLNIKLNLQNPHFKSKINQIVIPIKNWALTLTFCSDILQLLEKVAMAKEGHKSVICNIQSTSLIGFDLTFIEFIERYDKWVHIVSQSHFQHSALYFISTLFALIALKCSGSTVCPINHQSRWERTERSRRERDGVQAIKRGRREIPVELKSSQAFHFLLTPTKSAESAGHSIEKPFVSQNTCAF